MVRLAVLLVVLVLKLAFMIVFGVLGSLGPSMYRPRRRYW